MLIKLLFFALTPVLVSAEETGKFTYKEPVVIGGEESLEEASVGETLEGSSRFNYYENQSLRSFSSVFVEGVDQRFLDVAYNGFSLRDPSSTTGVFNMASLAAFRGSRFLLRGGSALEVESKNTSKTYVEGGVSNLEEFSLSGEHTSCDPKTKNCRSIEMVAQRAGGFSQLAEGREDDFYEELSLSASQSYGLGGVELTSRLLYYGQLLDLDSIIPVGAGGVLVESETAESLNSVLFVGQDVELSDKHKLMLSYTHSYRNQRDSLPLAMPLSFRQRGEVLEAAYVYDKNLTVKIFSERFDLYSSKGLDTGFKLKKVFSLGNLVTDVSLGKTNLRSVDWSVETGFKNFVLFYKGVPPSLFQQSYNDEFSANSKDLNAQEFLGVRHSESHNFSFGVKLKWNWSYSRIYRFVDFDLNNNTYSNLGEVENYFMGLRLEKGPLWFFVEYQIAREVAGLKRDLPRRAPWTLGLRYENKITNNIRLSSGVKWISERKAFDQTALEATWVSDLKISYKGLSLSCTNLFSNDETVFKNLGRRPLTARLYFQKNF